MTWAFQALAIILLVVVLANADHPGHGAIAPTRHTVRTQQVSGNQRAAKGSASALHHQDNDGNDNDDSNNNKSKKNQNQNNNNDYNNNNDSDDNDYNDNTSKNSNKNDIRNDYNDNNNNNNSNDNDYLSGGSSSQHVQQQQSSSGSYGASSGSGSAKAALDSNNVASVIRVQEARDQSLKTLYNNAQTLVNLNFGPDFYEWNPRLNGPNGSWQWVTFNNENNQVTPADNTVLQRVNANGKVEGGAYASAQNSVYQNNNQDSYATLSTLPYGSEDYVEGFITSAHSFDISATQRLVARMLFSCRTVDVDKHPFPKQYVTYPEDDERLANCALSVAQANASTYVAFYLTITNRGVWAVYVGATFVAKRRIGARARYDSLVDGAIEIDGRTKTATFYLNGYKVWTIYQIGTLPPADGYTNIDVGEAGTETVAPFTSVNVEFGTEKCLDESNPWNLSDTTRLARIRRADDPNSGAAPYYGSSKFYDPVGERGNLTWGQGAVMTLYKLKVMRTTSIAPRPVVLPGVYGDAAPVYQRRQKQKQASRRQQYENDNNNKNNENDNDDDDNDNIW